VTSGLLRQLFYIACDWVKVMQNIKTSLKNVRTQCLGSTCGLEDCTTFSNPSTTRSRWTVPRNVSWTGLNPRLPMMLVNLQLQPAIHITCPYLLNKNTFLQPAVHWPEVSPPLQSRSAHYHRKHAHVTRRPPGSYRPEDPLRRSYKHSWVWNVPTQSSAIPHYTNGFSVFNYGVISMIRGIAGDGVHG